MCFFLLSMYTCTLKRSQNIQKNGIEKKMDKLTPIIEKDALFIDLRLTIDALSRKEIYADLSIKNNSKDSLLLYKILFPFNGDINYPVFSIFSAKTYDDVTYLGPLVKYKKLRDDDEGETVIPDMSKDNFVVLHSGETISFKTNIAQSYDFGKYKAGDEFNIVPSITNPYVSFDYKQVYEIDSVDGLKKPVYYYITFPRHENIDSMRLKFKLQGD
jgi:hypothetical protein